MERISSDASWNSTRSSVGGFPLHLLREFLQDDILLLVVGIASRNPHLILPFLSIDEFSLLSELSEDSKLVLGRDDGGGRELFEDLLLLVRVDGRRKSKLEEEGGLFCGLEGMHGAREREDEKRLMWSGGKE